MDLTNNPFNKPFDWIVYLMSKYVLINTNSMFSKEKIARE